MERIRCSINFRRMRCLIRSRNSSSSCVGCSELAPGLLIWNVSIGGTVYVGTFSRPRRVNTTRGEGGWGRSNQYFYTRETIDPYWKGMAVLRVLGSSTGRDLAKKTTLKGPLSVQERAFVTSQFTKSFCEISKWRKQKTKF